jgi:hypothetical protein
VLPKQLFMWGTFLDYMNSFIGAFFIVIGIIFIPEIKKSPIRITIAIILAAILVLIGWDKVNRDNKKDEKIERLNANWEGAKNQVAHLDSLNIQLTKKVDSSNAFMKDLKESFHIVKDENNKPVKYETNINNARDVYIGRD